MSTANTWPSAPTALANRRVYSPVPAPMSATAMPGFSLHAASTSSRG